MVSVAWECGRRIRLRAECRRRGSRWQNVVSIDLPKRAKARRWSLFTQPVAHTGSEKVWPPLVARKRASDIDLERDFSDQLRILCFVGTPSSPTRAISHCTAALLRVVDTACSGYASDAVRRSRSRDFPGLSAVKAPGAYTSQLAVACRAMLPRPSWRT